MLGISAQWGQTPEMDKLLEAIGPKPGVVGADDEGEDVIEWSPV